MRGGLSRFSGEKDEKERYTGRKRGMVSEPRKEERGDLHEASFVMEHSFLICWCQKDILDENVNIVKTYNQAKNTSEMSQA